ncbi:LysR family transcriptional regulator [Cupriavidus sp. SK-4]|uniref:LysR family transcriptional regulator n=1 Tax=Cupriavidus sp. SK-4 TaxID=574750 RepID=UPI000448E45C|nr:LysR family transcriptional regulator [Cupriavidus sp. SK-4]EYS97661.1 LysR family transcriptional regulator [Cupriavidus sp. SK-4]
MEIRQMRYFVKVVEAGSIGRAAKEMGLVSSGLSQQLTRLESELSTRLLHRTATGVKPTDAGLGFYKHAQLALRHVEAAAQAAQQARLAGQVSVGISSSAAAVMALPFVEMMKLRYPDIRVRLVGSLSLNLVAMLNARQLDMAVLFETGLPFPGGTLPLLEERMFLIGDRDIPELCSFQDRTIALEDLGQVPLVMGSHIVRSVAEDAFGRIGVQPNIVLEVDSLEILMTIVSAGFAATIQPGAITARLLSERIRYWEIASPFMRRQTVISSISEPEMSPAALAVRVVLRDVARDLVTQGRWPGAIFTERGGRVNLSPHQG